MTKDLKTPKELAAEWYWQNLTDQSSEVLLSNPPKYPADPRKAFLAGYQAAKEQYAVAIEAQEKVTKAITDYLINGIGTIDLSEAQGDTPKTREIL